MTTYLTYRKTSILDNAADVSAPVAEQAASSPAPDRPRTPQRGARAGIAIGVVCIVGVGALLIRADAEPDPAPPALAASNQGRSQRLVQESIDATLLANRN